MLQPIHHPQVWRGVRSLYLGAGVLFLATISLGILNVFSPAPISRGQILAHFHSGSIGWVTLTVIATTLWLMSGGREISKRHADFASLLSGIAVISVAGYVAAFAITFHRGTDFWMLPLFGVPAGLCIVATFLFALRQCRHQEVSNAHLLLTGGLGIASLGATMGILLGLSYSGIIDLLPRAAGADPIGAHAGPMDMYLALAFGGIVELFFGPGGRWTKGGLAQMVLGVTAGLLAWVALFFGVGPAIPLALLLFLASFAIYMGRVGWRALRVDVLKQRPMLFFGGIGFPAYILLFVYTVFAYFSRGELPPHALGVVFVHVTFVAMASNLVFGMQRRFSHGTGHLSQMLAMGAWAMNIGLLAFIVGEVVSGVPHGALLMAVGALTAWIATMSRTSRMQWFIAPE